MGRTPRTIIDKLWDAHAISTREDGQTLLWIDRHLAARRLVPWPSTSSPPARRDGRAARPDLRHRRPLRADAGAPATPSIPRSGGMVEQLSEQHAPRHGIRLFGLDDPRQGIVHVAIPEQGLTLPGLIDRVRRQPHLDARRVRRLRLRHRRVGSRACADDADPLAEAAAAHAHPRGRRAGAGHHGEGHRADHHRPHRRGRGAGPRHRICRARRCAACRWRGA